MASMMQLFFQILSLSLLLVVLFFIVDLLYVGFVQLGNLLDINDNI